MRWEETHFKKSDFGCHCDKCGDTYPEAYEANILSLVSALEKARRVLGLPIRVIRGYTCAEHNKAVGGAKYSQHLSGLAVDIQVLGWMGETLRGLFEALIRMRIIPNGGLGTYTDHPKTLHYDQRKDPARWRD